MENSNNPSGGAQAGFAAEKTAPNAPMASPPYKAMSKVLSAPVALPPLQVPPEEYYDVLYCDFNDWFMPHATYNWPHNQLTINRYVAASLDLAPLTMGLNGFDIYAIGRFVNQRFALHLYTERPIDPDHEVVTATLQIADNGKDWHIHLCLGTCMYSPLIYGPLLLYLSTESSSRHLVFKSIYTLPKEDHLADAHRFTVKSQHAK